MNVAVLTLTRDRREYTRRCFAALEENAGCDYTHHVLDQGSGDGTAEWLRDWEVSVPNRSVVLMSANLGISVGMNYLLDLIGDRYDAIVKVDNDCELLTPNTLRDVCALAVTHNMLLSPTILGLNNPPATVSEIDLEGVAVDEKAQIGGVFLAAPANVYVEHGYRYHETNPLWGLDDAGICAWWRANGGRCGYVQGYEANHVETTVGQWDRFPAYFERTLAEGKPAL